MYIQDRVYTVYTVYTVKNWRVCVCGVLCALVNVKASCSVRICIETNLLPFLPILPFLPLLSFFLRYTPFQVEALTYKQVTMVSCGCYHTMAVTKEGK